MFKTVAKRLLKLQTSRLSCNQYISSKSFIHKRIGAGGLALLAVPVTTFCLGSWQVQRLNWKQNLIKEVTAKHNSSPVELPEELEDLSSMEYQRVHVRGRFDHSKEMYIGPRSLITGNDEGGGLMSPRSQSGNLVITPFYVADRDLSILVNRGWVPRDKTDPSKRLDGQITEEIDLIGTVRVHENRPQFCPKNKSVSNYFHFRDVLKMASMAGAEPIYIDADSSSTVPGGPTGGQTRITFRNDHLSYLLTWYSLSAATLYMWYKTYLRSPKIAI